ncbi:PHYHD1 [Branchiostoma lanceolatum]|uniref:PHYHD1 protein n=2 Tax=Branchiostoma lanceolatum TaxID=7740 RepID=A0A8K0AAT7_BRALA|nr:PHYHD1 [Branchiostoma lanceolatum]
MPTSDYQYEEGTFDVTPEIKRDFDENGYVIIRGILDKQEILKLRQALELEEGVKKHSYEISDGSGRTVRLCIWRHPGNDVTGMIARMEKTAGFMGKLLGGEVYHYSSKLIQKEPHTGGQFKWHQDYGYWYKSGCLFPDMGSLYIAIDKTDTENGCMQVMSGSHKLGRIDHTFVGGQQGAEAERVNQIGSRALFDLVPLELNEGDACFFHCNLLHCSGQNNSARRRWAIITSYNRASNNPIPEESHPWPLYTPIQTVPDDALLRCENFTDLRGKAFVDPATDKTVKVEPNSLQK